MLCADASGRHKGRERAAESHPPIVVDAADFYRLDTDGAAVDDVRA